MLNERTKIEKNRKKCKKRKEQQTNNTFNILIANNVIDECDNIELKSSEKKVHIFLSTFHFIANENGIFHTICDDVLFAMSRIFPVFICSDSHRTSQKIQNQIGLQTSTDCVNWLRRNIPIIYSNLALFCTFFFAHADLNHDVVYACFVD